MAKRATPVAVTTPPLPPPRTNSLVFIREGYEQDHISDFYEAAPPSLSHDVESVYSPDEGTVYVYKVVPYAVLEAVPAYYKVKE